MLQLTYPLTRARLREGSFWFVWAFRAITRRTPNLVDCARFVAHHTKTFPCAVRPCCDRNVAVPPVYFLRRPRPARAISFTATRAHRHCILPIPRLHLGFARRSVRAEDGPEGLRCSLPGETWYQ